MIAYIHYRDNYYIAERPDCFPSSAKHPEMYKYIWTTTGGEELPSHRVRLIKTLNDVEDLQDAVKKYPELLI